MDNLSPKKRSWNMSRIKGRDTKPEMLVRSLLHRMGYRFRLHSKKLPGKPDIVLPKFKAVILVHGCFWHGHSCREGIRVPKSNIEYWTKKISSNKTRDYNNVEALQLLGWKVFVVWECMTKDIEMLIGQLRQFLGNNNG